MLYIILMCVSVLNAALLYNFNAQGAGGFIMMMLSIYLRRQSDKALQAKRKIHGRSGRCAGVVVFSAVNRQV